MDKKQLFSQAIKDNRKKLGMTQQSFSQALGVSRVTVANWEAASHLPSLVMLSNMLSDNHGPDGWQRSLALDILSKMSGVELVVVVADASS